MRFLIYCFILFLFSAGHSLSFSQSNITIPDSINSFIFSKSANNQIKLITSFGSYVLKDSVLVYEKFKPLTFSKQINDVGRPLNNNEYRSIVLNEKLHLFHNGGGVVFEQFEGSFRRVDNSSLHLNQASGFYFEINNRLHLYGGFGLWTHKEYITFYDPKVKQWDINYHNSNYVPAARWKAIGDYTDNKLYVLGGRTGDSNIDLNIDFDLDDVFLYDFNNGMYKALGKVNPSLVKTYSNFALPKYKSALVLTTPEKITMIDFAKNEIVENVVQGEFLNHNSRYPCYIVDNNLYYISGFNNASIKSYDLTSLNNDAIQKNRHPLINNTAESKTLRIVLIGFVSLMFFWIMMKLFVYQDHIKDLILYDKNGIYYKKRFVSMSAVETKFIQLLSSEPFVSASMLNEILSKKDYSKSHLTELRDKFILKLKAKIENLTGEKDGIYETKHKDDKRIKGYKANGSFKKKTSFITHLFKIK
tara:strand:- start:51653 stop:53074 length:1422 start_codon:yes stop_codon:yes gene_type:complete